MWAAEALLSRTPTPWPTSTQSVPLTLQRVRAECCGQDATGDVRAPEQLLLARAATGSSASFCGVFGLQLISAEVVRQVSRRGVGLEEVQRPKGSVLVQ
jgi:hypothetical protein